MVEIIINSRDLYSREKLIKNYLVAEIKLMCEELELDSLEKIIITNDFTKDVIETQTKYNIEERGHTNNSNAIAVAKTISQISERDIRQTIVISEWIIKFLIEYKTSQYAYHFIHHEIAHVHDNYLKFHMKKKNEYKLDKLDTLLVRNSDPVWSEYIAVRLSSASFNRNQSIDVLYDELYVNQLLKLIESSRVSIRNAINDDRKELIILIQEQTSLMFKIASTTIGYIEELNLDSDFVENIEHKIKKTYFYDTWLTLKKSLEKLYNRYPDWNCFNDILELSFPIIKCWKELGVHVSLNEDNNSIIVEIE